MITTARVRAVSVLMCLAASAFGLDLSAGGGATAGSMRSTFESEFAGPGVTARDILTLAAPFGLFAWFDATYAQASIGFRGNAKTRTWTTTVTDLGTTTDEVDDLGRAGFLSFSLVGKLPLMVGNLHLFPLAGIGFDLNRYLADQAGTDLRASMTAQELADLNQIWVRYGGGADFDLTPRLRLRLEFVLGRKFLSQAERSAVQDAKASGATSAWQTVTSLEASVLFGYRF